MLVMSLIITACSPTASTPVVPAVAPVENQTDGTTIINQCPFDPNVTYSVSGAENVSMTCTDQYVKFVLDGNTIIGRAGADTYKLTGTDVETYFYFDVVDPVDNAVLQSMSNCSLHNESVSSPKSLYVPTVEDFAITCTDYGSREVRITASFQVRPISPVTLPQPRYVGEMKTWDQLRVGEDVAFCEAKGDEDSLTSLYPSDTIDFNEAALDEAVLVNGCFPGTVLNPATLRITYDGHQKDASTGLAYILHPDWDVQGGYPFVPIDQLQVGIQYLLCWSDRHRSEAQTDVQKEPIERDCSFGTFMGGGFPDELSWTVDGKRVFIPGLDGAYLSPVQ